MATPLSSSFQQKAPLEYFKEYVEKMIERRDYSKEEKIKKKNMLVSIQGAISSKKPTQGRGRQRSIFTKASNASAARIRYFYFVISSVHFRKRI